MGSGKKIKKICVLCLNSHVDVIQSSASLRAIRGKYPDAAITCVTARGYELPLKYSPLVDKFMTVDSGSFTTLPLILKMLHKHFDILIDLQYSSLTRTISAFSFPSRRTPIIGAYNRYSSLERHEIFLKKAGVNSPLPLMESWSGEDEIQFANDFLKHASISEDDFIVGLNPISRWTSKTWPDEYFAQIGDYLAFNHNARTILFGEMDEREKALRIYKQMEKKPVLSAGRVDFLKTSALIGKCDLFISIDNRFMHVARGYRIPSVVIFGGTSQKEHYPPVPDFVKVVRDESCKPCNRPYCPMKTRACLWNLHPETIIDMIEELIEPDLTQSLLLEKSVK